MEPVLSPLLLVDHSLLSFNSPCRFDNLTIMLYLLFVLPCCRPLSHPANPTEDSVPYSLTSSQRCCLSPVWLTVGDLSAS